MRLNSGFYKNRKTNPGAAFILTTIAATLFSIWIGTPLMGGAFSRHHPDFLSFGKFQHQIYAGPKSGPARGKFLIAGRKLTDPNFAETVILLIDYARKGAVGLIINRPTEIKLSAALPDIQGLKHRPDTVYMGGPVAGNRITLLVNAKTQPDKSFHVFGNVYIGPSWRIIQQMIDRSDPREKFRIYAGYAGWSPGQLDKEISMGDWHILQADEQTVFGKKPSKTWPELIRRFSSQWVRAPKHNRLDRLPQKQLPKTAKPLDGMMTHSL